ncbi:putative epimerase [Chlamydia trachomatis]|nr:putative epimerase [Chlamydia trachomatis]
MTIHAEATVHIHGSLQKIKAAGMKAGVVINPGTPLAAIEHVLNLVDQVLIMTVNPGFGGQAYIPEMADKIAALVQMRQEKGLSFDIEVDGGIDDKTIASAKEAGANVFVAGSYLFKGDLQTGVDALRAVLND